MAASTERWFGVDVAPGERVDTALELGQSYSGTVQRIPMQIWRGKREGPTIFITAAVHGDEINGTGVIRSLIHDRPFTLEAGTLVLVPVVNMLGFERHSRYLPDRRDLNRVFPGNPQGSLASRMARVLYEQLLKRCDYGIDLHTGAVRRTNFPNLRANLDRPEVADFAMRFGAELVVHSHGPRGSLRRAATRAGCPTILLEAGEPWKVQSTVVEFTLRGIQNVLSSMDMIDAPFVKPAFRARVIRTKWIRADVGGFLQFHVTPGDLLERGQVIATNTDLLGSEQNVLLAPEDGIVIGMTTLPAVSPGDAVFHLGFLERGVERIERKLDGIAEEVLHERLRSAFEQNVHRTDAPDIGDEDV